MRPLWDWFYGMRQMRTKQDNPLLRANLEGGAPAAARRGSRRCLWDLQIREGLPQFETRYFGHWQRCRQAVTESFGFLNRKYAVKMVSEKLLMP